MFENQKHFDQQWPDLKISLFQILVYFSSVNVGNIFLQNQLFLNFYIYFVPKKI